MQTQNIKSENSVSVLIGEIIRDFQILLSQEILLARHEIKDELNKTKTATVSLGLGICFALIGIVLFSLTLVHLIDAYTDLPVWLSYAIVTVFLFLLSSVCVFTGKSKAKGIHLMPEEAVESIKEDIQCIKNRNQSDKESMRRAVH